ncbi:hypothetical protein B0H16DRAFT_1448038 [Mycena metata]|uniref:Alpha/beta-hydrolase n=1 Tax=Mycena metata TaxID=1033252 RepID=A0AAD7KAM4_9AGAR|nr:hypothetical protein B0H16DRAFT_1448038 [Mycena metata]
MEFVEVETGYCAFVEKTLTSGIHPLNATLMSFTNINDPAGVKALLDSLRASQAWQSLVNAPPEQSPPVPTPAASTETPGSSASVAALLSQLNVPSPHRPSTSNALHQPPPNPSPPTPVPAPYTVTEDVRSLTFQQALPRLAELSDDPAVVATIQKARLLKHDQDKLERELWAERAGIRAKYEDKVEKAKIKATLIGAGLSKHEGAMLTQAYERELRRFDAERVLPAWDGLVTSQQAALAQLRMPTMFPTAVKADRERQQRVIQVLEGIIGMDRVQSSSFSAMRGVGWAAVSARKKKTECTYFAWCCCLRWTQAHSAVFQAHKCVHVLLVMPFVDLHSADDFASIHYITNSFFGNVGGFDPEKPTVFNDPGLDSEFNLIAFDMRVSGRVRPGIVGSTIAGSTLRTWRSVHQALRLAPFHILAMESISINCALRFAALFPEMCLSLALCNVPAPTELKWIYTAYDELVQTWCFAEDLESYEHVAMEAVTFTFGSDTPLDLRDDLIAYWQMSMNPRKRQRILEQANLVMNRTPLPAEAYPHIKQPILIIHGDANEACPRKYASGWRTSSERSCYTVKGGGGYLSIPPGTASIVNQVYVKFISRLPRTRSDPAVPSIPIEERMREALTLLETLAGTRASTRAIHILRSPSTEGLTAYRKGQVLAYLPLGPTGKPIRRYSERPRDDWFETQTEGISYAGGRFFSAPRGSARTAFTAASV